MTRTPMSNSMLATMEGHVGESHISTMLPYIHAIAMPQNPLIP